MALPRDIRKAVVAVVDDDRRLLEALQDLFESAGHDVRAFSSASEFLASDSFNEVACLVCDVCMPGMDGWGLQRVASIRRPGLPIVMMTAHANEEKFISPKFVGREPELFRKPFDGQLLLRAVESLLRDG